ncbi:hypothetical protein AB0F62_42630, partial [Streptomyces sp. NPDC026673]
EGHRLLAAAYRRDGSLQPIETLSAFSSNHRKAWTQLRGMLPAELDGLGSKITAVFDAIQNEAAPLQTFMAPSTGPGDISARPRHHAATHPADVTLPSLLPGLRPRPDLDTKDDNTG